MAAEPKRDRSRATPEAHHRLGAFVVEHFAVGEPRVVVHDRMDVRVADALTHTGLATAMRLPAATRGDAPQFLDVHMQQVAGRRVLVAADHPSGRPVEPGEPVQTKAAEHPVDGGGGESQPVADAPRAELQLPTKLRDAT